MDEMDEIRITIVCVHVRLHLHERSLWDICCTVTVWYNTHAKLVRTVTVDCYWDSRGFEQ